MSDIGELLRKTREEKQLSLDKAVQETSIRKAYLEAVEKNDFTAIPGEVFVKGIIRTYGNFLGLDGEQLVQEYKEERGEASCIKDKDAPLIRETAQVRVVPTFKSTRDIGSGDGRHRKILAVLAAFLIIGAAAGGVWYYLNRIAVKTPAAGRTALTEQDDGRTAVPQKPDGTNGTEKYSETEKKGDINAGNKGKGGADVNSAVLPQTPTAALAVPIEGETLLALTSTGNCWLRVQDATDKILYEGTLKKGEKQSFSSQGPLRVNIGNLKELMIEYNGKVLPHEETPEPVIRTYAPAGKDTK